MRQQGSKLKVFIIILLCLIALLQLQLMKQSDRFYESLNSFFEMAPETAPTRASRNNTSSPKDGDWLIWAYKVEPKTLNPISTGKDQYSVWITVPYIFEPLLSFDYDTQALKPFLAEDYDISEDGMQITFTLKDDIYFSDGEQITSDDVIFTFNTIKNPGIDAANIAQSYFDVDRAEKVDDKTVRFIMKRPYFKNLVNLAFTWDLGILPEHIYRFEDPSEFNEMISNPVGSGPYVFEKWETGKQVVLKKNENYWGKKPHLQKIIYRFIPNDLAALQALKTHKVDIMIPTPEQFADLVNDEDFNKEFKCLSYWTPWTPYYYIGWNQETEFFKDRKVRLAMTHIIDRKKIVSSLLKGQAGITTGPFYVDSDFSDPNVEPWPYDPEKARRLLDEAGWIDTDGDGIREKEGREFQFKFTYAVSSNFYGQLAKLLKDEARRVGIDVIPDPFEWSVLISKLNDNDFQAVVMGWGGDIVEDQYQIFHSSQAEKRGSNYVGFRNSQADELLENIRVTLDYEKRRQLCHQLHRLLHKEQPYTFLFTRPTFRFVDKRFKNVNIHELGLKYSEWYVPKEQQRYK